MSEQDREAAERLRQDAEAERQRREELRRIGEGGPEQHIPGNVLPGRVEAEAERVAAEEQRQSVRSFYLRLAAVVALPLAFVALVPALIGIYLVSDLAEENRATSSETKAVLCNIKHDFERRVAAGVEFLEQHPDGIPGISAAELQRSVAGQKATLASLRGLDCSDQI